MQNLAQLPEKMLFSIACKLVVIAAIILKEYLIRYSDQM
jgi:hypothetical protein